MASDSLSEKGWDSIVGWVYQSVRNGVPMDGGTVYQRHVERRVNSEGIIRREISLSDEPVDAAGV